MTELSAAQVLLIGMVATILVQLIKVALSAFKVQRPSESTMLWISLGVSIGMSILFQYGAIRDTFIGVQDPLVLLDSLSKVVPMVFGMAYAIYKLFAKKLMEQWAGLSPEAMLTKFAKPENDS